MLLEVDTESLQALRVAINALIDVEDLAGREDQAASTAVRNKLADLDRARLTQGLLVLSHLLGTHLARNADTALKTVLTGLGEHVDLEVKRRT